MKKIIVCLAWILAVSTIGAAQTSTTYLPQIAVGLAGGTLWQTHLAVTNPAAIGTSTATVTITFTKSDGTAFNILNLMSDDAGKPLGTGNVTTFQLSGGQSRFLAMDDQLATSVALAVGFATVTSSAPVTATALFVDGEPGPLGSKDLAKAGVTAAVPLSRQAIMVIKTTEDGILQTNPAIAFANPNSVTATVVFQVLNTSGVAPFPSITRTLAANNQTAIFVTELFPNLPATFLGTMQITTAAQTPLAATTLLFGTNGQFAAFPIVPLP